MSKRRRTSSVASRGADDDSDDGMESSNPVPPPSGRKKKKMDPSEICQQLYDTIRSYKKEDGTLLCDSFIRAPKRRQEPQYYEVVSQPIDLLRVQQKLKTDTYEDIEELSADIELLVNNAKAFYKPDTIEYKDASDLWKLFIQHKHALDSGDELKIAKLSRNGSSSRRSDVTEDLSETSTNNDEDNVFEELFNAVMTATTDNRPLYPEFQFLPSKRRYPEYYNVIDSPIDLKTIAQKIQGGEYTNLNELERDMLLMVIQVKKQEIEQHGRTPCKTSERIRSKRTSRIGPVPTSATMAIMEPPGSENESDGRSDMKRLVLKLQKCDFELEDKECSGARKKFEDVKLEELLNQNRCQTLTELGKTLPIDESTVSKHLKVLGMIQKQGHWVSYELKPRDVEWRFLTCELLLQRQKRKVKTYLEMLQSEVLLHPPYSPDIVPSDFHLLRSIAHGLAAQRFHSYEEAKKWIDSWIASKDMSFFRRGIHILPERWEKHSEDSDKGDDSDTEDKINEDSPQWKLLDTVRNHLGPNEKVIPEMYQRVRAKVLELLKDLPHIVITTDIWTSDSSSQSNDFISLTAHGITATFEYKSYCLEILPFDGSHTGTNIASNLNKVFHDWNIQDRVRAIVSDNAANISVVIRDIQETHNVVPVKCLAHSLQLVIKARLFKDDKVKEMITKARSIIGHFNHSTSSNKVLKEMQDTHNIANHVLIQDISTRWDSTLQALRRLLQRVAVQACLPRITCKAELTTEEWIMMEKVQKRLVELIINLNEDLYSENASDMVAPTPSTSSEMTASGGLWSVCENIIRESEEDDPLSTLSNNSLKEEVEKYLRSPNIPRDADPTFLAQ
ncbi:Protein polybromo-1 [Eumeta japonica]|uniref:Protein polybromo-1 n=1 Tax=Eumeta variegata TaxID=151549 RepID=A0A4C1Y3Z5_EUMVA|nr:Protein polybromo-1 [Eumeta japonica]